MNCEKNMLCKTILKNGPNKGLFCLRKNCSIKQHNNIALFLNLPKEIVIWVEKCKHLFNYNILANTFNYCSKENDLSEEYKNNIIYIFNEFFESTNNTKKLVLFIYIYKILDFPLIRNIFEYTDFYKIANEKLKEFKKCKSLKYKIFIDYIKENFLVNKNFFNKIVN